MLSKKTIFFRGCGSSPILDVQITQKCQMQCPMCINSKNINNVAIDFNSLKKFLKKIKKFKRLCISGLAIGGGEPLIEKKKVFNFIKFAKKLGFFISLNTNGLNFTKKDIFGISPYLDIIHLPLDGSTPQVQFDVRKNRAMFYKNLENIKHFNQCNFKGIVKVATVVTSKNYKDVLDIPELIKKEGLKINLWRLYQYRAEGVGAKVAKELQISEKIFKQVASKATKKKLPFVVAPNYAKEYVDKIFVLPDGRISFGNDLITKFNINNFEEERFINSHSKEIIFLNNYIKNRIKICKLNSLKKNLC